MADIFQELDQKYPSQTHKFDTFTRLYAPLQGALGAFAEFGCYNGGGARDLARLDPSRTVFAFDTFQGMPQEDYHPGEDDSDPPGKWKPLAGPAQLFEGIPNIIPVVGRFAETLPAFIPNVPFVLVHIDCDYYESYTQVFNFLAKRMVPGGVALLDDYGMCAGATRATDEWVAAHPELVSGHLREGLDRVVWRAV